MIVLMASTCLQNDCQKQAKDLRLTHGNHSWVERKRKGDSPLCVCVCVCACVHVCVCDCLCVFVSFRFLALLFMTCVSIECDCHTLELQLLGPVSPSRPLQAAASILFRLTEKSLSHAAAALDIHCPKNTSTSRIYTHAHLGMRDMRFVGGIPSSCYYFSSSISSYCSVFSCQLAGKLNFSPERLATCLHV